jgi:hypothetical protein
MSLPRAQQRTLDAMAAKLRASEPRLAAMFAMFARLTGDDANPLREEMPARRWYRIAVLQPWRLLRRPGASRQPRQSRRLLVRALILSQVAIAVAIGVFLMGLTSHSGPACGKDQSARIARFTGRAAVPEPACPLSAGRGGR